MTSALFGHPSNRGASLAELDARARDIFRRIVEAYLETGEPVGSRTLSRGGIQLSPASIRNTMQDLTELGLLGAPHVSAGRVPTHAGLRLFVDGLLEVGDLAEEDRRNIEARLTAHGRSYDDALNEASSILSGLAGGAGVVVTPAREAGVKHVEFVSLEAPDQALAIMVFEDGQIENRLMRRAPGMPPSVLVEASNFLNARLRGRTLVEAKAEMSGELERARRELNEAAARLIEDGLAAWSGGDGVERALIVRGRANLLGDAEAVADLERVRMLFDDLEQKEQLDRPVGRRPRGRRGAHLHRRRNATLFPFGFRCDRGALYVRATEGAGRDQGVIGLGAFELCPRHSVGVDYTGPDARADHGWAEQ